MDEELKALKRNHTWDIVSCPGGCTPIGCKWVYSIKQKADGSLVTLGNWQEYGVNCHETFALVAKMTTVRTLLTIAGSQAWPLF